MNSPWQRSNIQAAAAYLRERMAQGATDSRTKAIYEGLLDVLEPQQVSDLFAYLLTLK